MNLFLMEQTGKMILHCPLRGFSRVGALGKSVRVRLQDGKLEVSVTSNRPVLQPKKHVDLKNFEVNLYPGHKDPALKKILESGSPQTLLKFFDAVQLESMSPKCSTQGIVTLWNMELMKQAYQAFRSSETDGSLGTRTCCYTQDPSVNRIVSHIVCHAERLQDKPLAASLYCMWLLKFDMRGADCQILVNELLKRRSRLALPALARLCLTLRKESLYGNMVLAEFSPLLHSYVRNMSRDDEVRLVSLAIRGAHAVTTKLAADDYVGRVKRLLYDRRVKLGPATLCAILQFLTERQRTLAGSPTLTEMAGKVLRRAGNMLIPHVPSMHDADVLNILKILEFEHEPAPLIDVLSYRLSNTVEKSKGNASIHLLARMRPSSLEEKVQLEDFLRDTLGLHLGTSCHLFPALSKISQKSLYPCHDREVFNAFLSLYEQALEPALGRGGDNSQQHEWPQDSDETEDINFDNSGPVVNFLRIGVKYIRICAQIDRAYRHSRFEARASRLVLEILGNYEHGRCIITTHDYAGCIAFLIATGHPNVTIKPSFLKQFRARQFILLDFGMRLSGGYCNSTIETALEKQFPTILRAHFGATEYLQLAEMTAPTQGQVFQESMRMVEILPWNNARFAMEFLQLIKMTAYYTEGSFQRICKFICQAGSDISWNCATDFVLASYMCSAPKLDSQALWIAADVIEKNPCKGDPLYVIRTMLGLCYHRYLSNNLMDNIFSAKFIRHVDKRIKAKPCGSDVAANLRDKFMQLNRAVRIDMPEARIPWFHEKCCQHKAQTDILVHIDEKWNPLPALCTEEAIGRLAVIVHNLNCYTTGDERRLKGFHELHQRQLEALGYRVIEIDPLDWHSLRSSKNGAEEDYLRECIFQ